MVTEAVVDSKAPGTLAPSDCLIFAAVALAGLSLVTKSRQAHVPEG